MWSAGITLAPVTDARGGTVPAGGRGRPSSSDTGASTGLDALAHRLSDLARTLEQEDDLPETLQAIVHAAAGTIPGAQHASISAVKARREVVTLAATGELPRAVDRAQYETGQGPCLDSLFEQRTVRLSDVGAEERWPQFCARAAERGMGSMLSLQLFVDGDDLGALNLHSEAVNAFDDDSEHVGLLFASHAAVAMAGAQEQNRLREGMHTRDLIGQAKGILMERFNIDAEQAFRLLVKASQDRNQKLRDIAHQLAHTGDLTAPPPKRPSSA